MPGAVTARYPLQTSMPAQDRGRVWSAFRPSRTARPAVGCRKAAITLGYRKRTWPHATRSCHSAGQTAPGHFFADGSRQRRPEGYW